MNAHERNRSLRTLLIRPGGIGDCIVSLPAMKALGSRSVEVWTNASCIPIVPLADRVRCATARGIFLLEMAAYEPLPQLARDLNGFDAVYSWYGIGEPTALRRLKRLCRVIEFFEPVPSKDCRKHAVDLYCDRVEEILGEPVEDRIPTVRLNSAPRARRDAAILRPFASSERKQWPADRFGQLAQWLSERTQVEWLLRSSEEMPFDPAPGRVLRLEDLDHVADALSGARIYVGNDTGISHLAAAVGTPSVVLFGPTDPVVWCPRGTGPVNAVRSDTERIADVDVDQVIAAAGELLSGGQRAATV